jgi:hypothetical protein
LEYPGRAANLPFVKEIRVFMVNELIVECDGQVGRIRIIYNYLFEFERIRTSDCKKLLMRPT